MIEIVGGQGRAAQCQISADVLAERPAFAAFPWLKLAAGEEFAGLIVLASLVVERAKLNAEIVALIDEIEMFRQLAQTFFWFFANALPKLVALVEKAGVGWIGLDGQIVRSTRFARLIANVEVGGGKVAPDDRKIR